MATNSEIMTAIEKMGDRLDAIEKRIGDHDELITALGCADPKNQRADQVWRDLVAGALAINAAVKIVSAVGRVVLMLGGVALLIGSAMQNFRGAP